MFRRIVVPLDGSPTSERALPVATSLARASGGTLIFVKVVNQTLTYSPLPLAAVNVSPLDLYESANVAQAYLNDICKRAVVAGLPIETYVESGPVAATIITTVGDHQGDLLVLNSHGRSGLARWVLGSVARKVARHAPVPVLVLRDDGRAPSAPQPGAEHPIEVLVPLDGSPQAEAALQPADELLAALSGTAPMVLSLLQVVEMPRLRDVDARLEFREELDAITLETALRDARAYLEHVAIRLRALPTFDRAVSITTSVVFDDDITQGILEGARGMLHGQVQREQSVVAAIAMATHGRGGLDRWALGSVTERVLQGTNLPLLIVPLQHAAAAGVTKSHHVHDDGIGPFVPLF